MNAARALIAEAGPHDAGTLRGRIDPLTPTSPLGNAFAPHVRRVAADLPRATRAYLSSSEGGL